MVKKQTAPEKKFSLNLDLTADVGDPYGPLLEAYELVNNVVCNFKIGISNNSDRIFPGCSIALFFSEFGMNPGGPSVGWSRRMPISVPKMQPGQSWDDSVGYFPVVNGLLTVKFTVTSVRGKNEVADVELTAFRTAGSNIAILYYNIVSRTDLSLGVKLEELLTKIEGR